MAENVNRQFAVDSNTPQARFISRLGDDSRVSKGVSQMLVYMDIEDIRIEHPESYVRSGESLAPYIIFRGQVSALVGEIEGEKRNMYLNHDYPIEYVYRLNKAERAMFDYSDDIGIYSGKDNEFNNALNAIIKKEAENMGSRPLIANEYGEEIRDLRLNEAMFYVTLPYDVFMPEDDSRGYVVLYTNGVDGENGLSGRLTGFDGTFAFRETDLLDEAAKMLESEHKAQRHVTTGSNVKVISENELSSDKAESTSYLDSLFDDYLADDELSVDNKGKEDEFDTTAFEDAFSELAEEKASAANKLLNDADGIVDEWGAITEAEMLSDAKGEEEEVAEEEAPKIPTGYVRDEMEKRQEAEKQRKQQAEDGRSKYEKPDELEVYFEDVDSPSTKDAEKDDDLFLD